MAEEGRCEDGGGKDLSRATEAAGPSGVGNLELTEAQLAAIAEKVALKLLAAKETPASSEKEGERVVIHCVPADSSDVIYKLRCMVGGVAS